MKLESKEDDSVNWVTKVDVGKIETRYVRRDDYFIAYLSSQTGCKQACKFCHLTATGQTSLVNLTKSQILREAQHVIDHAPAKVKKVHFSFMARGEPLVSPEVNAELCSSLMELAQLAGLRAKILISTIMPHGITSLIDRFPTIQPNIYYSIYSTSETFRQKWLPKAMPVKVALAILREWQLHTNKIIKLHWAFIEGENDSPKDVENIVNLVDDFGLKTEINIIRYNPPDNKSKESKNLIALVELLEELSQDVRIIRRVGFDVKASCGMFV